MPRMIIAVSVCPTVIHKPLHWNMCAGGSPLSMFTNVPFWPPIFAQSWPNCRPLKNSFREFKVVFIKILTNEPWILSVYRQIVTGYFSVCNVMCPSTWLTTFILAPFLMSLQISMCYPISSSLLTYYRRYVCSDQFLSYQPDIKNNVI